MPLDSKPTHDELTHLAQDLHEMSYAFRDCPMSKEQLREYLKDLTNYRYGDFTYSVAQLRHAIAIARQKFNEPGPVMPKVRFIMDVINPKA